MHTNFNFYKYQLEGGNKPLVSQNLLEGGTNPLIYRLQLEGSYNSLALLQLTTLTSIKRNKDSCTRDIGPFTYIAQEKKL